MVKIIGSNKSMYLDMVKGFTIFLMLWGHCVQLCYQNTTHNFFDNIVIKIITSFHMPLFMLISGYLFYYSFKKRPLNQLVIHRSKPLLHTIVICGIFLYYISYGVVSISNKDFSLLLNGSWLSSLSGLWFLWSVLAASLIVAIVCKKVHKLWLQITVLLLLSFATLLFPNGEKNLFMYPYFILGFYFSKYKHLIPEKLLHFKHLSIVLFPVMLLFYERKHYIYVTGIYSGNCSVKEQIMIDGFRYAIGLVGSVFALTVLELIYKAVTLKLKKPFIGNGLALMGKYSLQIYALSTVLLSFYLPLVFSKTINILFDGNNIFLKNMFIYNFFFTFSLSVAYSFLLYYVVKLLYKIKVGYLLFGR